MNLYKIQGKRIRASDKNLVYCFLWVAAPALFVAALLLLNMGQPRTDWSISALLDNGMTLSTYNFHNHRDKVGLVFRALVAFLFITGFSMTAQEDITPSKAGTHDTDNKWYEAQTVQDTAVFSPTPQSRLKEKSSGWFKIYYQMDTGLLHPL